MERSEFFIILGICIGLIAVFSLFNFGSGSLSLTRNNITDFWDSPFWSSIPDKPSTFPPSSHTHTSTEITDWSTYINQALLTSSDVNFKDVTLTHLNGQPYIETIGSNAQGWGRIIIENNNMSHGWEISVNPSSSFIWSYDLATKLSVDTSGNGVLSGGLTIGNILTMPNNVALDWKDSGGTARRMILLSSANNFHIDPDHIAGAIYMGGGEDTIFNGNILIPNNYAIYIKDSLGTARRMILLSGANSLYLDPDNNANEILLGLGAKVRMGNDTCLYQTNSNFGSGVADWECVAGGTTTKLRAYSGYGAIFTTNNVPLYIGSNNDWVAQFNTDKSVLFLGDIKINASSNGLILKDRTTGTYYRIYIDNGIIYTETI